MRWGFDILPFRVLDGIDDFMTLRFTILDTVYIHTAYGSGLLEGGHPTAFWCYQWP